jgi:hypothetical protein
MKAVIFCGILAGSAGVAAAVTEVFAPRVISGLAHDAAPAFTPDGDTVHFSRSSAEWAASKRARSVLAFAPAEENAGTSVPTHRDPVDAQFDDLGNGVLKDTKTGLQWTQADNGSDINWHDAKSFCKNRDGSWRLPAVDELEAIYNANAPSPKTCFVHNGTSFPCKVSHLFNLTGAGFWSGTQSGSAKAWDVTLIYGTRHSDPVSDPSYHRALCVRRI